MNVRKMRYALAVAADALDDDDRFLGRLIDEDGDTAEMTAPQVIHALRLYAALLHPPAPWPSPEEQAQIDRFGIFAETPGD